MKKILFLANIQFGEPPTGGGVQTRNQYMLNWFQQRFDTKFYDTWQKNAFFSLSLSIILTILYYNRLIVVSYGIRGAKALAKLCSLLHIKRNVILFVPGGDMLKYISASDITPLSFYNKIFVQGNYVKEALQNIGFLNVFYCPNFRNVDYYPIHESNKEHIKFVYVGRLLKEKGIEVMLEAFKRIVSKNCSLTIYGKETEYYNWEYFSSFNCPNLYYKGYLDLKQKEGYDKLASYDVLLFPTFYEGEGFPGILVDALICSLPVIATEFNANTEIITDNKTGIIIPIKDPVALENAMHKIIHNDVNLQEMSNNCRKESSKYDVNNVLTSVFSGEFL